MVERRGLLLACEARLTPSAVSEVREERAPVLFERSSELRVSPGAFGHLCSQGGEFGLELGAPFGELLAARSQREAELAHGIDTGAVEGMGDGHGNHHWEMAFRRGRNIRCNRLA